MDKNTNARLSQASIASTTSLQGPRPPAGQLAQPAQPGQPPPGAAPDIGAMIRRVFAHWPVIVVTMVLGAVITLQVVRVRKATFKSETVIFYREGIGKSITGATEGQDVVRSLGTKLKETLLAQQTLRKIIDEFKLYPEIVQKSGYADAVDQMRKKTEFKSRSTDTFAIAFEGMDRDQAQKVCARMADLLVAENARRLQEENKGTTEFLEAEKKRADDELDRVEREMSEFLQAHPEFASAKEGLGTEVLALKSKADEEEKRRNRPKTGRGPRRGGAPGPAAGPGPSGPSGPAAPDDHAPAVDPVLLTARSQAMADLISARKDLAEKSMRFTEQHPDVRAAADHVAAADAALKRAEEAITAAAPAAEAPRPRKVVIVDDPYADSTAKPAPAAAAPVDPDAEEKDKPKAKPKAVDPDQSDKVVNLEMEWAKLGRAHALAKTHQADLENKLYRAEMVASTADAGYGTSIAVLDPAFRPSGPSNAPNRTVLMMGFAASLAVGVVLSAAWGLFLDDRLFSPNEIEGIVMVPVLGVVPRDKRKEKGKDKAGPPALGPDGVATTGRDGAQTPGLKRGAARG